MTREEILQDLAYARTLAEEGKQAPLIGGGYLILFGVLLAAAYSAQYAVISGYLPSATIAVIWLGFGVLAGVGCALLGMRMRKLPGGMSAANQADRSVWNGVAIGIICVVIGCLARGIVTNDFTAPNAIMAAGFGMYGIALYTTGNVSSEKWMKAFAWIAFLASMSLWYFINEPWAYLIAAAAAVIVLIIPGAMLLRREPSTVV